MLDPEMYFNKCQNYYERNHIYIPDFVGYADGRLSIQVDNDNVEYFPDISIWKLNKVRVFGVYEIFDKLELSDEEPLFWACLKRSVGSERCNFNWSELLCQSFDFCLSEESDPYEVHFEDVSKRISCKKFVDALNPLLGELVYTGSDKFYDIYRTEKYGVVRISKETNIIGKRTLILDEGGKFPRTKDYLSDHPLFNVVNE